jgi:hypothetical protein
LSDRTGRRKVFVVWSGVVMAVAAPLLAVWPQWTVAIVGAAVLGAGFGVYVAVDAALITQVLPQSSDRAKDLGVINIANSARRWARALRTDRRSPRWIKCCTGADRRGHPPRQRAGLQSRSVP